jgi:lipoprotein-releasing system permease protein
MFHPLSLFIGLRYAKARSHRFFVSFITWVSFVGVAVGVAALIVILSVMNGFETELRGRLLSLSSPVRVSGAAADWPALVRQISTVPGVKSAERFAEMQVLAVRQPEMLPLLLRGADADTQARLAAMLVSGDMTRLNGDAEAGAAIVLGSLVAEQMGVVIGDSITLLVPVVSNAQLPEAHLREFTVVGLFEAGIQDHDAALAYASMSSLLALGAAQSGAVGLSVAVDDVMIAPRVRDQLRQQFSADKNLQVTDWTEEHASYFRAIKIEKTMMALILMLVVGVAAFNIVAMLVMVVTDKRTDIAILRTLGMSPVRVASVFISQGLIVGWIGVTAGLVLGVLLANNVGAVLAFVKHLSGFSVFDADVFYITEVPSELHFMDVGLIALAALLLTTLATIYPALRASATSPAEALRYE